jgi:hypothetical protein
MKIDADRLIEWLENLRSESITSKLYSYEKNKNDEFWYHTGRESSYYHVIKKIKEMINDRREKID